MTEDTGSLPIAVGQLRGQVDMLIANFNRHIDETRSSRKSIYDKIEQIHAGTTDAMKEAKLLKERIDAVEIIATDYSRFKERWKIYAAIGLSIWLGVSSVITPIVGGFLQKWLFNT